MMLPDSRGAGLPMTSCFLPDGCGVHGCGRVRCECHHALPQGISRKLHGISCIKRLDRITRCSTDDVIRQGHDATVLCDMRHDIGHMEVGVATIHALFGENMGNSRELPFRGYHSAP